MGIRPAVALSALRTCAGLVVGALLTAACTAGPQVAPDADRSSRPSSPARSAASTPASPSSSSPAAPSRTVRTAPALDRWKVGARPLPLRPDGFGRALPTPTVLRVRRLATVDLLPPPPRGRFRATLGPVTADVRERMGETWSRNCPVGLSDLRHLTLSFRGFDGADHTGELVVAASVANDVIRVFRRLFEAHYPIEEMRLVTTADLDAPPTGDGNNTAAYVCRATRGSTTWSAHAYGLAIDVNPFVNPYRKGDLVLPELASAYLDRSWRRPGMILPDGVVTRAFQAVGWTWGGTFSSVSDLMHFSANGR